MRIACTLASTILKLAFLLGSSCSHTGASAAPPRHCASCPHIFWAVPPTSPPAFSHHQNHGACFDSLLAHSHHCAARRKM